MNTHSHQRQLAAGLLLALAAACAKEPAARTCTGDGDCPSGSTCQVGVCQESMSIEITAPADQVATRGDLAIQVTVVGSPPSAVDLFVDGATQATATLTAPFAYTLDTTGLAEGSHELVASAVQGGRTFRSAARAFDVDRTAPAAPTVTPRLTSAANPVVVSGTAEPRALVTLREGGADLGNAVASGSGSWTVDATLAEGTHVLTATAADAAGNVSATSSAASLVVDRTPPDAPSVNAQLTNANPVTLTGAAEAGSTVTLSDGAAALGTPVVAGAGGTWVSAVLLSEGTHSITALATDAAGNVSQPSAAAAVVVDRTAPQPPTVNAQVTRAALVEVTGSAEPLSQVILYEGATPRSSGLVAAADGSWTASIAFAEGSHSLTATATDAAGNTSALSAAAVVLVDRTAPAAPTVTAQRTRSANPVTVSGTAEGGSRVTLSEGATVLASSVPTDLLGAWSAAVPLAEGTHALTATATDGAGNTSAASGASNVIVDRTAPTVTGRTPASGASNVWSRDAIVVTFSEAILPSSLTSSTVQVQAGGLAMALDPFSLSADGRTLTLTPSPAALPPVPATITATLSSGVTDLAGNALAPASWTWTAPAWILGPALHPAGDGSPIFSAALGPDLTMWTGYATSPTGNIATASLTRSAWSGSWSVTGTSPDTGFTTSNHRVAIDANGLVTMAYVRASVVRVVQYGGTWSTVSPSAGLNVNPANGASQVRLAIDGAGRPVVSWVEAGNVHAKRLSGGTWTTVSGPLAMPSGTHDLCIRPSDDAVAIAVNGRWYENGTQISGYDVDTSTEISIAYDGSNTPIAAYVPSGTTTVQVVRPGNPPASFFAPLGGPQGTTARGPKLVYRAAGASGQQLVVAYYEESSGNQALQVLGWNGSSWGSLSSGIGSPAAAFTFNNVPQLLVNGAGILAATWVVGSGVVSDLTPRIYNR